MEELKANKADVVKYYRNADEETQDMLRKLFGADVFKRDWREINSYRIACEELGITPAPQVENDDRPEYARMAGAVMKLMTIYEAINGEQGWYDKDGIGHFPVFMLYKQKEMDELGEQECKRRNIRLLASAIGYDSEITGIRCASTTAGGTAAIANFGFPMCLNSEEKARFVGKHFFELCCAYYGLTLKK